MDQIKIGRFIAEIRKAKGLTQKQLSEKLGVSDKTVSKWECGKGMPDNAFMLPLCEILEITVNELLSGERLSDNCYGRKAEENIINLLEKNEEAIERNRRTNMVYIVSEVLMVLMLGVILFVSTGSRPVLWYFVDIPALIVLLGMELLVLAAAKALFPFGKAFKIVFNKRYKPEKDEIWEALQAVKLVSGSAILSGGICAVVDCVVMLSAMDISGEAGRHLAVIGVSIFYGIIAALLLLPMKYRLEMLFYRGGSRGML